MNAQLMPPVTADSLATLLKAGGDPLRLQVLRVLNNNAFGALELSRIFDMRQNAMSHHLKLLTRAGLVTSRRESTHRFYRRNNGPIALEALRGEIYAAADRIPLPAGVEREIRAVEEARARSSAEFFRLNADKFREQQDLIARYPEYGEALVAIFDRMPADNRRSVLEVGPGEGELLADLHRCFARVTALDNSAAMLERSRRFADSRELNAIEFILGDTSTALDRRLRADVISLNMVLHHTPAPAAVVSDLARVLNDNGVLVVTELCEHDQDWAHTACGDLWLGFEPEELVRWARDAGLHQSGSEFLALKNGFRIQIHQFTRPQGRSNDNTGIML